MINAIQWPNLRDFLIFLAVVIPLLILIDEWGSKKVTSKKSHFKVLENIQKNMDDWQKKERTIREETNKLIQADIAHRKAELGITTEKRHLYEG